MQLNYSKAVIAAWCSLFLKLFHHDPCVLWGSRKSMFFCPVAPSLLPSLPLLEMNIRTILTDFWFAVLWVRLHAAESLLFLDSRRRRKLKDMASFDKNRSASGWWVAERKKELWCQGRLRVLYLQLYQITGSKLNQSQRNVRHRQTRDKKNQAVKSAAVSTGVIRTNSLRLGEERKTDSPFNLLLSLCLLS